MALPELAEELQLQILQNLDLATVLNLRQTNKQWGGLCEDETVWQSLFETTFGVGAARPAFTWKVCFIANYLQYSSFDWEHKVCFALHNDYASLLVPRLDRCSVETLFHAVEHGALRCLDMLLNMGLKTEINQVGSEGLTLLHAACQQKNVELAKKLLAAGADPNIPQPFSAITALHFAVLSHNSQLVSLLIQYKADVNAQAGTGSTPFYLCAEKGTVEIARLLLAAGANPDENVLGEWPRPIHVATSKESDPQMLQFLLEQNVRINPVMEDEPSPLILACEDEQLEHVKLLISKGADLNCVWREHTALKSAVQRGSAEIVELLCKAGANVNLKADPDELTPLKTALNHPNQKIIQILLHYGADPTL